jgi:hypothetical protein
MSPFGSSATTLKNTQIGRLAQNRQALGCGRSNPMALSPEVILVALRENVSYVTSRDPNKSTLGKNRRPGNPDRFSCPSELPAAKYDRHASNGERALSVRFPEVAAGF